MTLMVVVVGYVEFLSSSLSFFSFFSFLLFSLILSLFPSFLYLVAYDLNCPSILLTKKNFKSK